MLIFKVILVGDGAVGKTSLRDSYMGESFKGDYMLTIGVDFATKEIERDGTSYKFQIWDLAGQERFNFLRNQFLKGAHGAIFVFDVSRLESLESAEDWFYEVEKEISEPIPVIFLGNKIDTVPEDKRSSLPTEVSLEMWGKNVKQPITFTSALTGENVEEAFGKVVDYMLAEDP